MSDENSSHTSNLRDKADEGVRLEGDANMRTMSKASLSFILDDDGSTSSSPEEKPLKPPLQQITQNLDVTVHTPTEFLKPTLQQITQNLEVTVPTPTESALTGAPSKRHRPPSRICKADRCQQYVVDQGLCVRHGVRFLFIFLIQVYN